MRKVKKIEFTEYEAAMLWRASEKYRQTIMMYPLIVEHLSSKQQEALTSGVLKLEEYLIKFYHRKPSMHSRGVKLDV